MMSYLEKFKDWKQAPATSVQYDKLVEESNVSSRTSNDMSHVHSPILDAFRPQKKRRNWMCAGVGLGLVDLVSILHAQLAVLAKVGHQQNGVVDVNRHKGEGPSGHWRKPGQVARYGPIKPCGSTVAEAKARNCVYSQALGAWRATEC